MLNKEFLVDFYVSDKPENIKKIKIISDGPENIQRLVTNIVSQITGLSDGVSIKIVSIKEKMNYQSGVSGLLSVLQLVRYNVRHGGNGAYSSTIEVHAQLGTSEEMVTKCVLDVVGSIYGPNTKISIT